MGELDDVEQLLGSIDESLKGGGGRSGSHYIGEHADPELVRHLAEGGAYEIRDGKAFTLRKQLARGEHVHIEPTPRGLGGGGSRDGGEFIRDLAAAARGDFKAADRLAKGWVEGTPGAGGYLVDPTILPGYLAAARAGAPLEVRVASYAVDSDEVWVTLEGNTVTVTHVAEGATKPDTIGSVTQKISTVFKLAGTSHVSDELIADSNGAAERLVSDQFGKQISIALDTAIISGTGTGQPTGIRGAAGVTATAVDAQTGQGLYESILKAISRIEQRFELVDTVVVHPREVVKFALAKASGSGEYVWPNGIQAALPNGGHARRRREYPLEPGSGHERDGHDRGSFRRGAAIFNRQPLTVEASREAGFVTDETVIRGVRRYGFCVLVPSCFELLTGITP
jgi:HK97 family phage major capsid protein